MIERFDDSHRANLIRVIDLLKREHFRCDRMPEVSWFGDPNVGLKHHPIWGSVQELSGPMIEPVFLAHRHRCDRRLNEQLMPSV